MSERMTVCENKCPLFMNRYKRVLSKRTVLMAVFFLISVLFFAEAEENLLDYSDDFSGYAATVSQWNRQSASAEKGEVKSASVGYTLVLSRTDGTSPDWSVTGADYIAAGPRNCYTLAFSDPLDAQKAVDTLSRMDNIQYAELDGPVFAAEGDPQEGDPQEEDPQEWEALSWAANELGIAQYNQYALGGIRSSCKVAIVDSGVAPHDILNSRIAAYGSDFVDGDNDPTNDLFGHGTHVAGIVADCTRNLPVTLYPVRVLNDFGSGTVSNLVNGIYEAYMAGCEVINLSLCTKQEYHALDDIVLAAVQAGAVVAVAAGNDGKDASDYHPNHLMESGILVIGSAEKTDGGTARVWYSNYGTCVDFYFPGDNIRSCSTHNGYTLMSGTSMATPHISAVSAILKVLHPGISPQECDYRIKQVLTGGEAPVPQVDRMIPSGYVFSFHEIELFSGDILTMPASAVPECCMEKITYSGEGISGSCFQTDTAGEYVVTARINGLESRSFTIQVTDESEGLLQLPESVLSLEEEAFAGLESIRKVRIPDGVTEIGDHCFDSCANLGWVYVPDSVETIGEAAFSEAVVICSGGSFAEEYAVANNLPYITDAHLETADGNQLI